MNDRTTHRISPRAASRTKGRITLADVAHSAGVSPITVSRVLRGVPTVDASLKERVINTVRELGYVPDSAARSLASRTSTHVTVLVPLLTNALFIDLIDAAQSVFQSAGYQTLMGVTHYLPEQEEQLLREQLAHRPAGLLLTGADHTPAAQRLLAASGLPCVRMMELEGPDDESFASTAADAPMPSASGLDQPTASMAPSSAAIGSASSSSFSPTTRPPTYVIGNDPPDPAHRTPSGPQPGAAVKAPAMRLRTPDSVGFSQQAAARALTQHLLARGRRRIAFAAVQLDPRTLQRRDGWCQAMQQAGCWDMALSFATPRASSMALGAELLHQILQAQPDVDAIFFCNDDLAQGALLAALRRGISVPDRVAIAGFNDLPGSDQMVPPLTTVRTPRRAIGEQAAQLLLRRLRGDTSGPVHLNLGFELCVRGST